MLAELTLRARDDAGQGKHTRTLCLSLAGGEWGRGGFSRLAPLQPTPRAVGQRLVANAARQGVRHLALACLPARLRGRLGFLPRPRNEEEGPARGLLLMLRLIALAEAARN